MRRTVDIRIIWRTTNTTSNKRRSNRQLQEHLRQARLLKSRLHHRRQAEAHQPTEVTTRYVHPRSIGYI